MNLNELSLQDMAILKTALNDRRKVCIEAAKHPMPSVAGGWRAEVMAIDALLRKILAVKTQASIDALGF